jgi:hypothetical protein
VNTVILWLLTLAPAFANTGVPVLFHDLVGPYRWTALEIIVGVEALLALKILSIDWKKSLLLSAVANGVSSLLGIPLTFVLMLLAIPGQWDWFYYNRHCYPESGIVGMIFGGPVLYHTWNFATEYPFGWSMLCEVVEWSPFFITSVIIEGFVAQYMVPKEKRKRAWTWSVVGNLFTYALIIYFSASWKTLTMAGDPGFWPLRTGYELLNQVSTLERKNTLAP